MSAKPDGIGRLERFGTGVDSARRWGMMVWRLSVLMAKGAYLLGERRRLFAKLGEEAFRRFQSGELKSEALHPLVHQVERITKKIEIEEMLVRSLRFGSRGGRTTDTHSSGT